MNRHAKRIMAGALTLGTTTAIFLAAIYFEEIARLVVIGVLATVFVIGFCYAVGYSLTH